MPNKGKTLDLPPGTTNDSYAHYWVDSGRSDEGFIGRCTCGWKTTPFPTLLDAVAVVQLHVAVFWLPEKQHLYTSVLDPSMSRDGERAFHVTCTCGWFQSNIPYSEVMRTWEAHKKLWAAAEVRYAE
jgi:hypothetical protein